MRKVRRERHRHIIPQIFCQLTLGYKHHKADGIFQKQQHRSSPTQQQLFSLAISFSRFSNLDAHTG